MKKKNIIILASVAVVCALGLLLSGLMDWNVNSDDASGNIAKSSRFSRKTAAEPINNMEELLLNDENYKDGIVMAYTVMQARASHFGSLVDMSNQVAGDIPAFEAVLKDMNQAAPMVQNVCTALSQAGSDLQATLSGESCPEVGQTTINASLAYTTLQKQNQLASRFIDTADKYLESAEGSDRLKFVRDQWVEYQTMTAALEGDTKGAAEMKEKGALLNSEKTLNALASFDIPYQISMLETAYLSFGMDVTGPLGNALPPQVMNSIPGILGSVAAALGNTESASLAGSAAWTDARIAYSNGMSEAFGNSEKMGSVAQLGNSMRSFNSDALGNVQSILSLQANSIGNVANAMGFFVVSNTSMEGLCNQVNDVIKQTAVGSVATLGFHK